MMSSMAPTKARAGGISKGEAVKFLKEKMVLAPAKHKPIFDELFKVEKFEKLLPYDNAHTYAGEWYVTVPIWASPDFIQYIISSRELVFGIHYDKHLKIRMAEHQSTASADQENKTIWVSPLPFSENFMRDGHVPANEFALMSIAAGNGTLIHEAAHFAKSPEKITDMFSLIPHVSSREAMSASSAAYSVANLAEDIYIEDWLAKKHSKYLPFLTASHHLYFHDTTLAERVSNLYNEIEILSPPLKTESMYKVPISRLLDLLIATKNWRYDEQLWGGVILKYYKRFMEVRGMAEAEARARLIFEIWTEMREDSAIRWDEGTGDSPMMEIRIGNVCFDKDSLDKTCISDERSKLDEVADRATSKRGSVSDEIKDELEKVALVILVDEGKTDIAKVPPTKVEVAPKDMSRIEPDPRFKGLGRLLRQTFTHNYTPGEPQRRGQLLVNTRLYRIATDQKIFTYRERRKATGKDYEITVLVDCSGSMSGGKIEEAMKVGAAAYGSLRRARIRTHLLGHTSTRFSHGSANEHPLLFVIGLPKDPISTVLRRANSFIDGSVGLHNNYDGFAILESMKYFSDKPTKKWLFVISDGYPSGRYYGGPEANIHTSQSVKKARDKGIDVVSITIERGVYDTNDMIYGPKKNVKTTNSRVLKNLIEAMFTTKEGVVDG